MRSTTFPRFFRLTVILTWFPLLVPAQEQDVSQWPQFRGPTGLGLAASTHLPLTWGGPKGENILWQSPLKGQGHASPMKCWEAASGKLMYAERLEGISTTWASPIVDARGRLYFANAGKSYVVEGGPEFRVLAVNDLGDGNHASPAVARNRLFLVGLKNLYCLGSK